jgi:retron-type reverse transcriptase
VHHALCNIIEPIFDKTFICDSYANRKGKGTHAALKRFDKFKRKVSGNGALLQEAKDNNMVYGYVLKADIRHYFDSVDHEVLISIIKRRIKDEKIIWLIEEIVHNHNCKVPDKGMPLGNLTSQFFANVYLNELDQFVKHELKARFYIRYVDDFVILDISAKRLDIYKRKINRFLQNIRLELHPEKSKIMPLHAGIKFLGFRVFYRYKLPKKSNIDIIRNRVDHFMALYEAGIMNKHEIFAKVDGWNAYAMHGNTYKFRKNLMKKLANCMRA